MAMPKTTVDEERHTVLREHQVRLTGQILPMESKTESQFVRSAPDSHFGRGMLAANAGHQPRATFWG